MAVSHFLLYSKACPSVWQTRKVQKVFSNSLYLGKLLWSVFLKWNGLCLSTLKYWLKISTAEQLCLLSKEETVAPLSGMLNKRTQIRGKNHQKRDRTSLDLRQETRQLAMESYCVQWILTGPLASLHLYAMSSVKLCKQRYGLAENCKDLRI